MQTERLGSLPLLTLLSLRVFLRCPLANKDADLAAQARSAEGTPEGSDLHSPLARRSKRAPLHWKWLAAPCR